MLSLFTPNEPIEYDTDEEYKYNIIKGSFFDPFENFKKKCLEEK